MSTAIRPAVRLLALRAALVQAVTGRHVYLSTRVPARRLRLLRGAGRANRRETARGMQVARRPVHPLLPPTQAHRVTPVDEPKPPPPTDWITTTEVRDGPGPGAIYGVAVLCLALIGVLFVLGAL